MKDDAIAPCLDRIYAVDPDKLFSNFALSVYTEFDLDMDILHGDTTNIVMYGEYECVIRTTTMALKLFRATSRPISLIKTKLESAQ